MKQLLVVLLVVVVAAVAVAGKALFSDQPILRFTSGEMQNPYAPGSALHAQQQEFVDQFNADPKLRDRFAGTFTSKGLYAEVTGALERGARSLDSAQLISLARAMAAVMRNPVAAPDGEACWAINTLTHTSTQLSPDHAEAIARLIWGGQ